MALQAILIDRLFFSYIKSCVRDIFLIAPYPKKLLQRLKKRLKKSNLEKLKISFSGESDLVTM